MGLSTVARLHRLTFTIAAFWARKLAVSAEANLQWSPALGYWSVVAARAPRDARPRAHQLRLLTRLGRVEEAHLLAQRWTREFGGSAEILRNAAEIAHTLGRHKEAALWILRSLRDGEGDHDARLTAVRYCILAGMHKRAGALLDTLEREGCAQPAFVEWRIRLALSQRSYERVSEGLVALRDDGRRGIIMSIVRGLPRMSDRAAARRLGYLVVEAMTDDVECAVAVLRLFGSPDALDDLERVHDCLTPDVQDNPRVKAEYGRALVAAGQSARGILRLEEAVAQDPNDNAVHHLASSLHRSLHWSRALPHWQALVERRPKAVEPHVRILDALIETGLYDDALVAADNAIEALGARPELLEWRARVPFAASRWAEALEEWQLLLRKFPGRAAPWYYTGMAGIRAGVFTVDEALAHFAEGLNRHPGATQLLEKHAQVAERAGAYEDSLASWRLLLEKERSSRAAWTGISRQLLLLDRHDEAAAHHADMAAFDPASAYPLTAGALSAAMQGDLDQARALFDQALERTRNRLDDFLRRNEAEGFSYSPSLEAECAVDNADYQDNVRSFNDLVTATRQSGSVVIVGNAPSLLGKALGPRIDSHDLVVRLNDFLTGGYESDTGCRTDHWMSALGVEHRKIEQDLSTVKALVCYMRGVHFGETEAVLSRVMGLRKDNVTVLPNFVMLLLNDITYFYPSTGLRAILLYKVLGLDVSICGFDFFKDKVEHYYDCGKNVLWASESHSVQFEYRLVYDMLVPLGHLRHLVPDVAEICAAPANGEEPAKSAGTIGND